MAAILAIETSSDACSVALRVDDVVLLEECEEARAHARVLLPTIETLLARASLSCARLDAIVYDRGPGSFTGLRIGCAVAQALAWAHDLPTLGVSSLAVLAEAARRRVDEDVAGLLTVLDARMDECYLAVRGADASDEAIVPDRLVRREELDAVLAPVLAGRPGRWIVAGDGASFVAGLTDADLTIVSDARAGADALLAIAAPRLATESEPARCVQPVYLRDESRWRRQAPAGV